MQYLKVVFKPDLQERHEILSDFFGQVGGENFICPCSDLVVEDIEGQAVDTDLRDQLPTELANSLEAPLISFQSRFDFGTEIRIQEAVSLNPSLCSADRNFLNHLDQYSTGLIPKAERDSHLCDAAAAMISVPVTSTIAATATLTL
jgi:hypothetical protein